MSTAKESKSTKAVEQHLHFTKYEISRIIGARALQISMNAPILIALKKEELEAMNYDSLKIAELEFKSGILPITVKRPFPQPKEIEEDKKEDTEVVIKDRKEQVDISDLEPADEEEQEVQVGVEERGIEA